MTATLLDFLPLVVTVALYVLTAAALVAGVTVLWRWYRREWGAWRARHHLGD